MLYLHGNAGNVAVGHRVKLYETLRRPPLSCEVAGEHACANARMRQCVDVAFSASPRLARKATAMIVACTTRPRSPLWASHGTRLKAIFLAASNETAPKCVYCRGMIVSPFVSVSGC